MLSIKQIKMHGENHILPQRFGGMHLNRCRLVFNIPPTVATLRGRGPLGPSNQAFEEVKYKSFYTMAVLQKRKLFIRITKLVFRKEFNTRKHFSKGRPIIVCVEIKKSKQLKL